MARNFNLLDFLPENCVLIGMVAIILIAMFWQAAVEEVRYMRFGGTKRISFTKLAQAAEAKQLNLFQLEEESGVKFRDQIFDGKKSTYFTKEQVVALAIALKVAHNKLLGSIVE